MPNKTYNSFPFYLKINKILHSFLVQGYSLKCTARHCIIFLGKSRRLVYKSVVMEIIKFNLVRLDRTFPWIVTLEQQRGSQAY